MTGALGARRGLRKMFTGDMWWKQRAACKGKPTKDFYPETKNAQVLPDIKTMCAACPVHDECLAWATDNNETGHWAGTTEGERRQARRKRRTA